MFTDYLCICEDELQKPKTEIPLNVYKIRHCNKKIACTTCTGGIFPIIFGNQKR